jgi:hypothetical protein
MFASGCSIQKLAALQTPGTGRWMAGDTRQEEPGRSQIVMARIKTAVDIIV